LIYRCFFISIFNYKETKDAILKNKKKLLKPALILSIALSFYGQAVLSVEKKINLNPERKIMDVNDLGFEAATLKTDSNESELLQVRSSKLQRHQFWGLTTWGLMTATVLSAPEGGPASNTHMALAGLTALSYATTAYLSLSAPEPANRQSKGNSLKIHKIMMWIHLPGMILTPLAGIEAHRQAQDPNRPRNSEGEMSFDGIAGQKKALASMTYAAFTMAMLSMTFDF